MVGGFATFVLQTPDPGVVPDVLFDLWPLLVQATWFSAGFLVVLVVGRYVVQPAIEQIVRRRNRRNQTIQEAITRYVQLIVLIIAVFVGMANFRDRKRPMSQLNFRTTRQIW
jgi:hypothetical protein